MNIVTEQRITVDFKIPRQVKTVSFLQYDTNVIRFIVEDNHDPANMNDITSIVVNFKRPDGLVVSQILTAEGNEIVYRLTNSEMAKLGVSEMVLQLYDNDNDRVSIAKFNVNILDNIEIGEEPSVEDVSLITQLIESVGERVAELNDFGNQLTTAQENISEQMLAVNDLTEKFSIETEKIAQKVDEDYVGISAEKIGLIAEDTTKAEENTRLLNNFLSSTIKKTVVFTSKTYYFNNTIVVTPTNKLKGTSSTNLNLLTNDVDFIYLKPKASIESLSFMLFTNHTKSCVTLRDDDYTQWHEHYLHSIKDIFIFGSLSHSSIGISLKADSPTHNVSNLTVINATIMACHTGIKITQSQGGWSNGNFFDSVYTQACKIGIYVGNACSGNRFLYQSQFDEIHKLAEDDVGIYCEGNSNTFIGKVWDPPLEQKMVYLTVTSSSNCFLGMDFGRNIMSRNIVDDGQNNIFTGFSDVSQSIPNTAGAYVYGKQNQTDWSTSSWQRFYGAYSNVLHNASKLHETIINAGNSTMLYGEVANLFNRDDRILLTNTPVNNPIVIETILSTNVENVPELGITFDHGCIARYVKFEFSGTVDGEYTLLKETTDNSNYYVAVDLSAYGATIRKLRITLADAFINPTINPNGVIGVGSIYMYSNSQMGNYYLPTNGGHVYGAIDMNGQAITNKIWHSGTTTNRPTDPKPFQEFFDVTLGKPIWRSADNSAWIDATGTTV